MRDGEPSDAPGRRADDHPEGSGSRSLLTPTMLGVASGAILVPLNSTMLAVALPSVAAAFAITPNEVASLVTLYLGAVAVTLPASGSIGDRFGHRRSFLAGVLGFGLASLIAAFAPTFVVLALSRVLQAASGSLISTSSVALIRDTAPPDRRGSAFGLFDLLVSASAALGPLIGGLIVGFLDWRAMFFLAAPVAVLALLAVGLPRWRAGATRAIGESPPPSDLRPRPRPIDAPGLLTLALVLIAFLVALRGGETAVPASAAAIVLFAMFLALELRSPEPAVDLTLFRSRSFAAAVVGVLGSTIVLHATLVLVPLLVERIQGGDPEVSGLVLLGISALGGIAAPVGGRWSDRAGRRLPVVVGCLVMTVGLAILWQVAGFTSALVVGILLSIVGLGMGLTSPRQVAALETVGADRVGMAAGTYYTGRYLGGVLGASLAGAVLGARATPAGVTLGFGILTVVGIVLVVASFGLSGRPASAVPPARS